MVRFSERTGWERESNEFALAVERARAAGHGLLDLTVSNPTRCGFEYPPEWMSGAGKTGLAYEPAPRGIWQALDAVAGYYRDMGVEVSPEQVVMTASTSEAYSFLFRLLCDAGDEVLAARPSYPLFDFLAGLEDVRLVEYPLFYDYGWHIDLAELEKRVTARTRAVVVVHPNNPTGNYVGSTERAALEEMCGRLGLALIVDEVFLDFPASQRVSESAGQGEASAKATAGPSTASFAGATDFAQDDRSVLSFVLSGVSKVCALPQMKVSWMVVCGPEAERREALERLEVVADTFLSVSTPAQLMLAEWLAGREVVQAQVRERMEANLAALREAGLEVLQVDGGWTAVLRLSGWQRALEAGVMVQPGSFYGLGDGRVVVSLITPVETMRAGARVLAGL